VGADGSVVAEFNPLVTESRPALPADLGDLTADRLATTGAVSGSGQWRYLARPVDPSTGGGRGGDRGDFGGTSLDGTALAGSVALVAVPTGSLDEQMSRLLRIELTAATALLAALGGGAWLLLRQGLRPLEVMAHSATTITAGDLTQRVSPADERTEVGQLGLALNTMLDGIELSFREREATEARLRQFLADASHELRTPLTSIQGFAELFRLGPDDARVDLPAILRRIEEESARMAVLVEDLLLLARLDQTRPFAPVEVDLAVVAADACTDAVATDPTRAVTLDAPFPVVVHGDEAHLRQAVANLVTNALRHTPPGSPIEVAARVERDGTAGGGDAVGARGVVVVRDHGPGLAAEDLDHAFDRFWQADAARVGTGAGLGLAIVAGIADEHGGSATLANAVDGGAIATFRVAVDPPPRG
jgi:two-component system OmpR family sensor kinase